MHHQHRLCYRIFYFKLPPTFSRALTTPIHIVRFYSFLSLDIRYGAALGARSLPHDMLSLSPLALARGAHFPHDMLPPSLASWEGDLHCTPFVTSSINKQPFLPTVSPTTTIPSDCQPSDCQPPRNQINLPPFSCALDTMATTGHNQHTAPTALWGADFSLCTLGRELLLSCEISLACSCSFVLLL